MNRYLLSILIGICFANCILSQNINSLDTRNSFQSIIVNPKSVIKTGENHYFIDFGKDAFGTLIITSKSKFSDTLIIHLSEKVSGENTIDRNPGGTIRYQNVKITEIPLNTAFTISLPPDKRNTGPQAVALPDSFGVIMPFRYCELENLSIPIEDLIVQQKVYHYNFDDSASEFISSDTVLNKVWDLCKYSIKATSFAGVYVDGDRERIPYEADAYINQMSHFCLDDNYFMARRTNEYFIKHPTWPTEWILHTVLLFYYDFMYSGDIEPIKKHYEDLRYKTLIDLEKEDGLISSKSEKLTDDLISKLGFKNSKERIRDIVDWPPAQKETSWKLATPEGERDGYEMVPINTVVNSFHYINLKLMAELAGYLGKKEDSILFSESCELVKKSINEKLFDKNKGIYIDGEGSLHSSIHANMFPLAFGIVPKENIKTVVEFIRTRGMACSVYGAQYLLEGLYLNGEADYPLQLMTSTNDRSWWNMILVGSTITMEAWDMKYKPNSDWNHAWGAAPGNIITRFMWGITPLTPGFGKAQIKPQLSNLTYSKIKVPTSKGTIISEYKVNNKNTKVYLIELPKGMEGDFVITAKNFIKMYLNGKKISVDIGPIKLKPGLNKIEFKE